MMMMRHDHISAHDDIEQAAAEKYTPLWAHVLMILGIILMIISAVTTLTIIV